MLNPLETGSGSTAIAGSPETVPSTLGTELTGSSGLSNVFGSLSDPFGSAGSEAGTSGLTLGSDPFANILTDLGFSGAGLGSEAGTGLGTFGTELGTIWADLAGLF
jgi:hypothetical protein